MSKPWTRPHLAEAELARRILFLATDRVCVDSGSKCATKSALDNFLRGAVAEAHAGSIVDPTHHSKVLIADLSEIHSLAIETRAYLTLLRYSCIYRYQDVRLPAK